MLLQMCFDGATYRARWSCVEQLGNYDHSCMLSQESEHGVTSPFRVLLVQKKIAFADLMIAL